MVVTSTIAHNILPADHRRRDDDYDLLGELFGLSYAQRVRDFSYGPEPLPMTVLSLLALPPDFVATDVEARKFLVGVETLKLAAFGISFMVCIENSLVGMEIVNVEVND